MSQFGFFLFLFKSVQRFDIFIPLSLNISNVKIVISLFSHQGLPSKSALSLLQINEGSTFPQVYCIHLLCRNMHLNWMSRSLPSGPLCFLKEARRNSSVGACSPRGGAPLSENQCSILFLSRPKMHDNLITD